MIFLLIQTESADGTESFRKDDNTNVQLSMTVVKAALGESIVEAQTSIVSLGQVIVGAMVSLYLILCIQLAVFLHVSVAMYTL
jgi:hypothetical protein